MFPEDQIQSMFNPLRVNSHSLSVQVSSGDDEDDTAYRRTSASVVINPAYQKQNLPPSILSVDAGLTNNSFTLVVAHLEESTLVASTVLEIIPHKGTQINFPGIYREVIKVLIKEMNVHVFASDRWNSITTLQTAADDFGDKLRCIQRTLTAKDFGAFRDSVENGLFQFPALEMSPGDIKDVKSYKKELLGKPLSHLFLQFLTTKQENGVFVKGDGYTDDILRSLAVAHSVAFNPKVREFLSGFRSIGSATQEGVTRSAVFSASKRTY
jgi:hypothetical protein